MTEATKVGIIYSVAQRLRRVLTIPDYDGEVPFPMPIRDGEKFIEQSMEDFLARGPDAAVADDAGGSPLPDRCVVVDQATGLVINCIHADPAIDALDGHHIIEHAEGSVGDRHRHGVIERRHAIVDARGKVTDVVWHDIAKGKPTAPTDGAVLESLDFQIGHDAPLPRSKAK